MPYKLECYNFNPHEIIGDFDYDPLTDKPIILKSKKTGRYIDKHLRLVNKFGFLTDNSGNIINNEGRMRLRHSQLRSNGDFPLLLNYEGKAFDIRSIIGRFERDPMSKLIVFPENPYS